MGGLLAGGPKGVLGKTRPFYLVSRLRLPFDAYADTYADA
jgi:hypothetical protein